MNNRPLTLRQIMIELMEQANTEGRTITIASLAAEAQDRYPDDIRRWNSELTERGLRDAARHVIRANTEDDEPTQQTLFGLRRWLTIPTEGGFAHVPVHVATADECRAYAKVLGDNINAARRAYRPVRAITQRLDAANIPGDMLLLDALAIIDTASG